MELGLRSHTDMDSFPSCTLGKLSFGARYFSSGPQIPVCEMGAMPAIHRYRLDHESYYCVGALKNSNNRELNGLVFAEHELMGRDQSSSASPPVALPWSDSADPEAKRVGEESPTPQPLFQLLPPPGVHSGLKPRELPAQCLHTEDLRVLYPISLWLAKPFSS